MPKLTFISSPANLPEVPADGRIVCVDIAFAHGDTFDTATRPFIEQAGSRLAAWIDHHDHERWADYKDRDEFVLVGKLDAPACPQLVTHELVQRIGQFEHLFAHADFDGMMTAVKILRGGESPYPEADEDARAVDYPGRGHSCSDRGRVMDRALDHLAADSKKTKKLLGALADALVTGHEPPELTQKLESMSQARLQREDELRLELARAEQLSPEVRLLRFDKQPSNKADRQFLLRELQTISKVGMVLEGSWLTVATYTDHGPDAFDLSSIPGLNGQAGYAYGGVSPESVVKAISE